MSKPCDYSKWDRLEISDDEKDAHPNIDSSLMIRIKREQRARREAEEAMKVAQLRKIGTPEAIQQATDIERKAKLHVDNICRVVDEKTIVNKAAPPSLTATSTVSTSSTHAQADREEEEFEVFAEKHEPAIREYGHLFKLEESERYLLDHLEILNEHACGWMLLHTLSLEMAGDRKAMLNVTRQYLMLRNIIDLAKEIKQGNDARPMVQLFFKQVSSDPERRSMLETESTNFAQQIIRRAVEKKKEMLDEQGGQRQDEEVL